MDQKPLHYTPKGIGRYGQPLDARPRKSDPNERTVRIIIVLVALACFIIGAIWAMRFGK